MVSGSENTDCEPKPLEAGAILMIQQGPLEKFTGLVSVQWEHLLSLSPDEEGIARLLCKWSGLLFLLCHSLLVNLEQNLSSRSGVAKSPVMTV